MIDDYETLPIVKCFENAVNSISSYENPNDDDKYTSIHPKTVLCWYTTFNVYDSENGYFVNRRKTSNRKTVLPTLFDNNPEVQDAFTSYCYDNLSTLSAELLHEYMLNICLPVLLNQRRKETNNKKMTMKELLQENNLQTLNVRTIQKWLSTLGFKYSPCRKNYYNDKHESEENIAYRHQFIRRYFQYELCTHRWVQLPKSKYEEMKTEGKVISGDGYEYKNEDDKPFIEFHVDDYPDFGDVCDLHPFGGNLSVRKPQHQKPLIIIGQDKCIYIYIYIYNTRITRVKIYISSATVGFI